MLLIVAGVALFMYKPKSNTADNTSASIIGAGELLLALSLLCDGLTGKTPLSGKGFMFENSGTWPNYLEKYSRILANLLYSNEIQIHWEFFSKIHQMALAMV